MSAPFYRAPWVRWSLVLAGAYVFAALSPWGPPQWRDTPSLRWLHSVLPWSLISMLLAVYVLLLAWGRLIGVVVAESLGAVLYGWEFVALIVTTHFDDPTNPLATAAVALVVVLHLAAVRLALTQLARESRG